MNLDICYGVTIIEDDEFRGDTSLASITIPDSVTRIGDCAFDDCALLTSIAIPDSVTSIGEKAFGSGADGQLTVLYNGKHYERKYIGFWAEAGTYTPTGEELYDLPEEFYKAVNGN